MAETVFLDTTVRRINRDMHVPDANLDLVIDNCPWKVCTQVGHDSIHPYYGVNTAEKRVIIYNARDAEDVDNLKHQAYLTYSTN